MSEEEIGEHTLEDIGEHILDIDRLCYALFACLYQHYKDPQTSILAAGIPSRGNFLIPEEFEEKKLGLSQIYVNEALRPQLRNIFDAAGEKAFCTEGSFKDFVEKRCSRISFESIEVCILTYCAVVSELNLYCFQRDCFRFANYAPFCLYLLLRKIDEVKEYFMPESKGFFGGTRNGWDKLNNYCVSMLKSQKKNSDYIPGLFNSIGERLRHMDIPVVIDEPTPSTNRTLPEDDYDKDDEEGRVDGFSGTSSDSAEESKKECSFCQNERCSYFFRVFRRELRDRFPV